MKKKGKEHVKLSQKKYLTRNIGLYPFHIKLFTSLVKKEISDIILNNSKGLPKGFGHVKPFLGVFQIMDKKNVVSIFVKRNSWGIDGIQLEKKWNFGFVLKRLKSLTVYMAAQLWWLPGRKWKKGFLHIGFHPIVSHYAKIQKYEQGKIGLQFFDMWC